MMDRLPGRKRHIAVKIILGIIILSFVFAGVGSYIVGGGNNSAAKVGNTEIGRGEFEQAYQNEETACKLSLAIISQTCWPIRAMLRLSASLCLIVWLVCF